MNDKSIDITNCKFGKLTVIKRDLCNSKSGNAKWVCKCDCGNIISVIGSKLRNSHTTSCGCNRISEKACGHSKERLYRIWLGMNSRCNNKNADNFQWYGGRGIKICDEWNNFMLFRQWALSSGYADNLSIDRIDSDGNYCPENCRWASYKEQQNNRSNNRIITYNNIKYTCAQFAEELDVPYYTIKNQIKLGWSIEKIVDKARQNNDRHKLN